MSDQDLLDCPHKWEGDEKGFVSKKDCCTICGITVEDFYKEMKERLKESEES